MRNELLVIDDADLHLSKIAVDASVQKSTTAAGG